MDNAAIDLQHQFYDMLLQSQYWSPERMRDYQRSQLSQLLHHAKKNVPFYEHRLDAVLKPNGDIDWDRWGEIPIVKRSDLQDGWREMQALYLPDDARPVTLTTSSGSSGRPVTTTQSLKSGLIGDAALARSHGWHRIDFNKTMVDVHGDDAKKGIWPDGTAKGPWGPLFRRDQSAGQRFDVNLLASAAQQAEFVARHEATYLSGLTSRIAAIAHEVLRQGIQLPLEAVLTRGEAAGPQTRRLFQDAFGARTVELYGAEEAGRLAHGCPSHEHLLANVEIVLIEIIDENGQPSAPGQAGQVVVTPFHNVGQPLIRYQMGDIGTIGGRCESDITLPVLGAILGRTVHLFRLPDGRKILPNVSEIDLRLLGARVWQLAQVAPDRAEFRYVTVDGGGASDETRFFSALRSRLDPALQLDIRRVEAFDETPGKKHIPYVCELN